MVFTFFSLITQFSELSVWFFRVQSEDCERRQLPFLAYTVPRTPIFYIECDRVYVPPSDRAVKPFTGWFRVQSEGRERRQLPFLAYGSSNPHFLH